MAEELARCLAGIVRLFCVIFCLIVGLQQIAGTASLLLTDWKGLKKGPKQILYHKILFEAVFGKVFYKIQRIIRGHSLFIFWAILF